MATAKKGSVDQQEPGINPPADEYQWYQHVDWWRDMTEEEVIRKLYAEFTAHWENEVVPDRFVVVPPSVLMDLITKVESYEFEVQQLSADVKKLTDARNSDRRYLAEQCLIEVVKAGGGKVSPNSPKEVWAMVNSFYEQEPGQS